MNPATNPLYTPSDAPLESWAHTSPFDVAPLVRCPVADCGIEYTHLANVVLHPGSDERGCDDEVHVTKNGNIRSVPAVRPDRTKHQREWERISDVGFPVGRRYAFELEFEGECGHFFSVVFTQHKGQTFMDVRNVDDSTPSCCLSHSLPAVLGAEMHDE